LTLDAKTGFEKVLVEAVDEGLAILGESVTHTIYYHVRSKYQVKREEIPQKLEAFQKALEAMFGAGAKILEKSIAKSLYTKLGLNFTDHWSWTIVDYVKEARKIKGM